MNELNFASGLAAQDRFGRRVAARLDAGLGDMPHDISERLRAARVQAMARRKSAGLMAVRAASVQLSGNGDLSLGSGEGPPSLWQQVATALPLIVLVAGLVTIHVVQNERRAREVAEVDAALLTDDLPPAAYADPGFVQFLKSDR